MNTTVTVDHVPCPRCGESVTPEDGERTSCHCGWRGRALLYQPIPRRDADQTSLALPEDSVCAHHPTKRAEVVCAGTGDYICSLCAIEVGGKTYSATFINRGGVTDLGQHFDRHLPRPDRFVTTLVLVSLFPYTMIAGPVLWVWALFKYAQIRRLRRENPLFSRVVGASTVYLLPLVLIGWAAIYVMIAAAIMGITFL